jgi:hypothetical protein
LGVFSLEKKVFQAALEPVDRSKLRNRFAIEKINKRITNSHSGVWEPGKADGRSPNLSLIIDNTYFFNFRSMWSDTGSYEFDSKGDTNRVVNLDALNLAGPINNTKSTKLIPKYPSPAHSPTSSDIRHSTI